MFSIEEFKDRMLKKWSIRNFRGKIETVNEEQKHWQVVLHNVDYDDIEQTILDRIMKGICTSPQISKKIKDKILSLNSD